MSTVEMIADDLLEMVEKHGLPKACKMVGMQKSHLYRIASRELEVIKSDTLDHLLDKLGYEVVKKQPQKGKKNGTESRPS